MADRDRIPVETLRQLIDYDSSTGVLTWRPRPREMFASDRAWRISNTKCAGRVAFTTSHIGGYKTAIIMRHHVYAHRAAWALTTGEWPSGHIDHISGVTDDNRIINPRDVDRRGNMRNQAVNKRSSGGVTGVTWDKSRGQWYASIQDSGRTVNLGRFNTLAEARAARKAANVRFGYHPNHGRS